MDFKKFLVDFEHRLVAKHGFERSPSITDKIRKIIASEDGADFIAALGIWIEEHPAAQKALQEMGMSWHNEWVV